MEGLARPRPSGTVTFVFTDIEGSAALWEEHQAVMRAALARHDTLVRSALASHGGYVFSTAGDAFCAAFVAPDDAVRAALGVQESVNDEPWPEPVAIRVRVGLHTGTADERDGDYFGPTVNRAARIMGTAAGGEVLASAATAELARGLEREGLRFVDLGTTPLRGMGTERVFGVLRPGERHDYGRRHDPVLRLPSVPTSTIGREIELLELLQALPHTRLVTLVGPGGVGKTRLAVEVGWASVEQFPDGVWMVELAPVRERNAVAHTLVGALDLRPLPRRPPIEALVAGLVGERRLVIIDNCEHVLDEVAMVVGEVVTRCPSVTVLATSRAALAISGERVWPVAPLRPGGAGKELFHERARAADVGFTVGQEESAVEQLCERLDGLPLAIELAAARIRSLSARELLDRLDDRFRLLRSGRRDAVERHATLAATVDWSFQLLSPVEQLVFERLGVFAGAVELTAVVDVVGDDTLDELDVLDALTALVDHSLVVAEREGGTTRYRLLDTMRAFARDRLSEDGELHELAARHARWAATRLETLLDEMFGRDPVLFAAARQELERFWPELRAAFHTAVQQREVDLAVRLVAQFSWDALMSEREELVAWCLFVLELPMVLEHPLASELLGSLAMLHWRAGRYDDMVRSLEVAATVRASGKRSSPIGSLELAEHIHRIVRGEVDAACQIALSIIEGRRGPVSDKFEGVFTILVAQGECYQGRARQALGLLAAAPLELNPLLDCFRRWVKGMALVDLDPAAAIPVLREACRLGTSMGASWNVDTSSNYLAAALAASGDPCEAVETIQAVLSHAAAGGGVQSLANTVRSAIVLLSRVGEHRVIAQLAGWLAAQSLVIPGTASMRARAEQALETASAALGADAFDEAHRQGAGLTVTAMVDLLRRELSRTAGSLTTTAAGREG